MHGEGPVGLAGGQIRTLGEETRALRPSAAEYDRDRAVAEAREFLAEPSLRARGEADRTLAVHRTW